MTDRGRALLEELEATWNQFVDSVNSLESHMDITTENAPLKS